MNDKQKEVFLIVKEWLESNGYNNIRTYQDDNYVKIKDEMIINNDVVVYAQKQQSILRAPSYILSNILSITYLGQVVNSNLDIDITRIVKLRAFL